MVSDQSPKSDVTQSGNSNKIFEIIDVDFPGDERGNLLASIEAHIKASAKGLYQEIINDLVITTTDKLTNQLNQYQEVLAGRTDWIGPAGVVIASLATLVASDFKDALSIKAAVWEAIFILLFAGSLIWFTYELINIIRDRNKRNILSLVQKIKERDSK